MILEISMFFIQAYVFWIKQIFNITPGSDLNMPMISPNEKKSLQHKIISNDIAINYTVQIKFQLIAE